MIFRFFFFSLFSFVVFTLCGDPLWAQGHGNEGAPIKNTSSKVRSDARFSKVDSRNNDADDQVIRDLRIERKVSAFKVVRDGETTSESGGKVKLSVYLTKAPISDVEIRLESLNPAEGKVFPDVLRFTPENWNEKQMAIVMGQDDEKKDGPQSYKVKLEVLSGTDYSYTKLPPETLQFTNIDNDQAGILVKSVQTETSEDGQEGVLFIRLSSSPLSSVKVILKSSDTSEGKLATSVFNFNTKNWNQYQKVVIQGVDDSIDDGRETYFVQLDRVETDDSYYQTVTPVKARLTNMDNDMAGILVSDIPGDVSEDGGRQPIRIRLKTQPVAPVIIKVLSSDLTEGAPEPDRVVFTKENWNQPQTVSIIGIDDADDDDEQSFDVKVQATSEKDAVHNQLSPTILTFKNIDNDTADIIVKQPENPVNENGTIAFPSIKLATRPTHNVRITLKSDNEAEGTIQVSQLIFTPENWFREQLIKVTGVDDGVVDGDQTFKILTSSAVSQDLKYNGHAVSDITVVNQDDDRIGFVLGPASGDTTEDGQAATFTIRLSSKPYHDVRLSLFSSDKSEGTVRQPSLVFTPETWNIDQQVTVDGQNDDDVDGAVSYQIKASKAVSEDTAYNGTVPNAVKLVNRDNNRFALRVKKQDLESSEEGKNGLLEIRLGSKPAGTVTVHLKSSRETEGRPEQEAYQFTPDNWNTPRSVKIIGVDDTVKDDDQSYTITVSAKSDTDRNYRSLPPEQVEFINRDNDTVGILVKVVNNTTDENGKEAWISIRLRSKPSSIVAFIFECSDPGEGEVKIQHVAFLPEKWNIDQIIRVTGKPDQTVDGDQVYYLKNPGGAISNDKEYNEVEFKDVKLINKDLDRAALVLGQPEGNTTEAGGKTEFSVRLNSKPKDRVVVKLINQDLSEAELLTERLTFTPDNWSVPQSVEVKGIDDDEKDFDQLYHVQAVVEQTNDPDYKRVREQDVQINNIDRMTLTIGAYYGLITPVGDTGGKYDKGFGQGIMVDYTLSERLFISGVYQTSTLTGKNSFKSNKMEQSYEYTLDSTTLLLGMKYRWEFILLEGGIGYYKWDLTTDNKKNGTSRSTTGNSEVIYGGIGFQTTVFDRYDLFSGYHYQSIQSGVDSQVLTFGFRIAM